jgi:pimeloyl-ACP methyl ester carboxylesterase
MDPQYQTIRLITYPLYYTRLKWIIPAPLRVTDAEKLSSIEQLKTMLPLWNNIIAPTYLLHGTKDWIVNPENSLFAQKMLKNAKVFYELIDGV